MKLKGVGHLAIAVADLDSCIERFERLLGLRCQSRQRVESNHVEIAIFDCGGTRIELVSPTDEESPIYRFLSRNGTSLHHICFEVEGLTDWLDFFSRQGVDLIDKVPRQGALGHRIAFLSPKAICNFLIELCEEEK